MESGLAVLPRDGVGPEVMTEALNVLEAVGERFRHSFKFDEGLIGGVARDTLGKALSYEALYTTVEYAKGECKRRVTLSRSRLNWRGE